MCLAPSHGIALTQVQLVQQIKDGLVTPDHFYEILCNLMSQVQDS